MKLNWGNALVLSLVIFAGIMATMVTIAMNENVDLVSSDYYRREIEFQDQIDNHNNAIKDKAIDLALDLKSLKLNLDFKKEINEGEIMLFRPSDASKDEKISIQTDINGSQILDLNHLESGLWKIKINWNSESEKYYFEKVLNIP